MELRHLRPSDLDILAQIEQENFDADEQIANSVLAYYTEQKMGTCLAIEDQGRLVAYVLAIQTSYDHVTDKIYTHPERMEQTGPHLTIASLSVASAYKRQGLGTVLLAGLKELATSQGLKGISLTCKESLISYYEMNGFSENGLSNSQFGGKIWYDMYWKCP